MPVINSPQQRFIAATKIGARNSGMGAWGSAPQGQLLAAAASARTLAGCWQGQHAGSRAFVLPRPCCCLVGRQTASWLAALTGWMSG